MSFRHLLQEKELAPKSLNQINAILAEKGFLLKEGTIVNATLIAAPPSTKNEEKQCDHEMH